jgi:putative ABC transport system ATP-binding protein
MKLTAKNITKSFNNKTLWSNVSFDILENKITVLTGKSGSGKTTLLNALGTIENIDSGQIFLDDRVISNISNGKKISLYRNTIGFLFQNYGLIENWSVMQNLEIGLKFSPIKRNNKKTLVSNVLKEVNLEYIDPSTKVYSLSGGEQQRVALARLMLKQPKIILSDEPSAALDSENVANVMNIFQKMTQSGITIVIATHDPLVKAHCDFEIRL